MLFVNLVFWRENMQIANIHLDDYIDCMSKIVQHSTVIKTCSILTTSFST